jgi:hypothetical protein
MQKMGQNFWEEMGCGVLLHEGLSVAFLVAQRGAFSGCYTLAFENGLVAY